MAPANVRSRLASIPEAHIETLQLDAEARDLADAYVSAGVLAAKIEIRTPREVMSDE